MNIAKQLFGISICVAIIILSIWVINHKDSLFSEPSAQNAEIEVVLNNYQKTEKAYVVMRNTVSRGAGTKEHEAKGYFRTVESGSVNFSSISPGTYYVVVITDDCIEITSPEFTFGIEEGKKDVRKIKIEFDAQTCSFGTLSFSSE